MMETAEQSQLLESGAVTPPAVCIVQVAVSTPVHALFDYLPPKAVSIEQLQIGMRVKVPFGKGGQQKIGLIMGLADDSHCPPEKLKAILALLDSQPLVPEDLLNLIRWVSQYYHYPIGEVVETVLPNLLNKGKNTALAPEISWRLSVSGENVDLTNKKAVSEPQKAILQLLHSYPDGLSRKAIISQYPKAANTLRSLEKKGWIVHEETTPYATQSPLSLNTEQRQVVEQVKNHLPQFYPCLLDGVTGSGKTEVYLHIIQTVIDRDQQALVLVPEINLTPQMIQRFTQRFSVPIAIFNSKLTDNERLQAWLAGRENKAKIIVGTRSAIWIPMPKLGIIIVDEEHDLSYKQQEGLRYSARDIAVVRAQQATIPVILGSATPSLDSLWNAQQNRYQYFQLPHRAGAAVHPTFHLVDMVQQSTKGVLSKPLINAIHRHLSGGQQVLLFINRRGYAPTLMCSNCRWVARCQNCSANMVYHKHANILRCHHCGTQYPLPESCLHCGQPHLQQLGQGTERLETILQTFFPEYKILRIDSDTTRRKYAMENLLTEINEGEAQILVGTQMLAKGHHFPKVTLVGIINIDGGLYGVDFRNTERMAQLIIQVAGRAGRAQQPGEVIIQTHNPNHPLLKKLVTEGYAPFAQAALQERQAAQFPPFTRLALLRAEAEDVEKMMQFLEEAFALAETEEANQGVLLLGPVPAPMEKREGRHRGQLLLQTEQRETLHRFLNRWLPKLPLSNSNKVRWSLDVDPQNLL